MTEVAYVFALCRSCGQWSKLECNDANYGYVTLRAKCLFCNSHQLDPQSVTSERSFNPDRARVRTNEVKKGKR